MGFTVSRQIEASDEETGRIIRTNPEAGVELELPARVSLYVSDGSLAIEPPADTTDARWPDAP
jgi:beta-lactam-binding protein with PASTA domain